MRSAGTELQNTIELRATASEIVAPKHCGNDPTVANHNGILSTAHARKTVETPFIGTDPTMIRG